MDGLVVGWTCFELGVERVPWCNKMNVFYLLKQGKVCMVEILNAGIVLRGWLMYVKKLPRDRWLDVSRTRQARTDQSSQVKFLVDPSYYRHAVS